MNEIKLVQSKNLRVGDRIVREKGIWSKHHGIYVGIHGGVPMVAENQMGVGVHYLSLSEFLLGNPNGITRIERFRQSEEARNTVIPRINAMMVHTPVKLTPKRRCKLTP